MAPLLSKLVVLAQDRPDMNEWVNVLFIVGMAILWIVGGLIKGASRKKTEQKRGGLAAGHDGRRETWQERLVRKAQEMQRAAEEKGRQATERVRQMEQGGPPRRPAPRPAQEAPLDGLSFQEGRRGEPVMVYDAGQMRRRPRAEPPPPPGRKAVRPRPPVESAAQRRERTERLRATRSASAQKRRPTIVPRPRAVAPELPPAATGSSARSPRDADRPQPAPLSKTPQVRPGVKGFRTSALIDDSDPDALKKAILHYEILGKPLSLRDPFERSAAF